jgi:hypothetical protein
MGWTLVPVLRLQAADKAEEPEVQGEAQGKGENASQTSSRLESSFARGNNKIKPSTDFTHSESKQSQVRVEGDDLS